MRRDLSNGTPDQTEIVWFSTVAAPYRYPVWEMLGRSTPLHVICFERIPSGREWSLPTNHCFKLTFLNLFSVGKGGFRIYLKRTPLFLSGNEKAVIVTGWASISAWTAVSQSKALSIPTYMFYESTESSHYLASLPFRLLRKFAFHRLDGVFVPGKAAEASAIENGVHPSKVTICGNTIDDSRFRAIAKSRVPGVKNGQKFAFIGRPVRLKNLGNLLRAFELTAGPLDELHLAGMNKLPKSCASIFNRMQKTDRVHFHGFLEGEEYENFLLNVDILVLPSNREVWGMVAHEAHLAGCKVIVSKACGISDELYSAKNTEICHTDYESIARAMISVRDEPYRPNCECSLHTSTQFSTANTIIQTIDKALIMEKKLDVD